MLINRRKAGKWWRVSGFSLVELLIVISIIAILSAFAYPSFNQSLRKSRRTDAQTALLTSAGNLERFFGTNGTYTTDTTTLGLTMDGGYAHSNDEHYVVTVAAGATGIGSSYVITATAASGDTQADDTGCTVLTIDSLGRRTPDPNSTSCW